MNDVGIVACGGRTSLGATLAASAAAVRANLSAIRIHDAPIDSAGEPMSYAADSLLEPDLEIAERFELLTASAIAEAMSPLTSGNARIDRLPLFLALPEPKPGLPSDLGARVTSAIEHLLAPGVRIASVAYAPYGHAAGLIALEHGWRRVQSGEAEFCLVGGVDSYLAPQTMEWLDAEGQLMSARIRSGFPPGEGAGFCLIANASVAHRFGLDVPVLIRGAGSAMEDNRIKSDSVCVGVGLAAAISSAAAGLRLPDERIDRTYCDLNGERYRSEEYTFAVLRTQTIFVNANDYVHPADCWGDIGAASGPLLAGLAFASAVRGYANGPRVLIWASSEGGQRGAVVLYLRIRGSER